MCIGENSEYVHSCVKGGKNVLQMSSGQLGSNDIVCYLTGITHNFWGTQSMNGYTW